METITLYHGSNVQVDKPEIIVSGFYKDFGYGFYCTLIEKQAHKWALTKKGDSIVSVYEYHPCTPQALTTLTFKSSYSV
ncbi:MAG: DUF3990 domain-containing protein [Bacteroidaceae bacterium]|nr:DUF3990 domain-containing protein [Bacteroidaceae bacterium]